MPEPDVGIMTFNRCVAVDQWEGMGRPDILEKNCHSTCPKSMIVTTKMYNPNMKVDILAIPPRVDRRRRVLQVEVQHARRGRPRVRPRGVQPPPAEGLERGCRGATVTDGIESLAPARRTMSTTVIKRSTGIISPLM